MDVRFGILIVDHHALVRTALRAMIDREDDLEVAGEAGSVADAMALLDRVRADVALIDVGMLGDPPAAIAAAMRGRRPGLGVLALSFHGEADDARRALAGGADGCVPKSAPELVLQAARAVAMGARVVAPAAAAPPGGAPRVALDDLSGAEREVLRRLAMGDTHQEIADGLGITPDAVRRHRDELMRKLGVRSRAGVVAHAVAAGLVPATP